jgi:nucleoid-associated protein YgaU
MSPTKLWIEVIAIVLLAAPVALAEETSTTSEESAATGTMPAEVASEEAAAPAESSDESGALAAEAEVEGESAPAAVDPAQADAPPASQDAAAAMVLEADDTAVLEADPVPAMQDPGGPDSANADEALAELALDEASAAEVMPEAETPPSLGAIGYDSEGRRGRVHIVVPRDTLWDISNAYLGTPWVWPSIWRDNDDIANPHLIHPGDHIWITPSEMRRVTPEEAAMLLANRPLDDAPAALDETEPEPQAQATPELVTEPIDRGSYRVSSRESAGLITAEQLEASGSIVDSLPERVLMSQEDSVYIGLGEGDVEPGDQLTIFRANEKVYDPDTGALLGYHVDILGWVEVRETYPETSLARIAMSDSEVEVGDRVLPREPLPPEIAIQASPEDVEGKISFFPNKRVLMGFNDFVYLNRGTMDGLEVGSPLSVYRPGRMASEATRGEQVHVPDAVIAHMLVVRTDAQSSVAVVVHSNTELKLGDRFRGAF